MVGATPWDKFEKALGDPKALMVAMVVDVLVLTCKYIFAFVIVVVSFGVVAILPVDWGWTGLD